MKSLVIFLVDNGEDIDCIDDMVRAAEDAIDVIDWTTRVQVPESKHQFAFTSAPADNLIIGSGDWPA